MTQDAGNLVVAGSGAVFVADPGTAEPDFATPLAADWEDLGLITPAGATLNYNRDETDIRAWGLPSPVLKLITGRTFSIVFTAMEWNPVTLPFFFGGGELSEESSEFVYEEPDTDETNPKAILVRWAFGDEDWQAWHPRGAVSGNAAITLVENQTADLPVTWGATPADNEEKFRIRTTSDQIEALAS